MTEKMPEPPTAPRAMSAPKLAAQLSDPKPPTTLLDRISDTRAPSPIAPEIDTPTQPTRNSDEVSLGTEPSPTTPNRLASKRKAEATPATEKLPPRKKGKALSTDTYNPRNSATTEPKPKTPTKTDDSSVVSNTVTYKQLANTLTSATGAPLRRNRNA
jgi:hypothetical protein